MIHVLDAGPMIAFLNGEAGDADTAFWESAATLKGTHALSLPDAFCLSLARRLGGAAVTTDHAEFGPLVGKVSSQAPKKPFAEGTRKRPPFE